MRRTQTDTTQGMPADFTPNMAVLHVIGSYPEKAAEKLLELRRLILEVAVETAEVEGLTETFKWNEPSYPSRSGSTVRINWRADTPDRCFMFFHCQTSLVSTFRTLYGGLFSFRDNRAIAFPLDGELPVGPLKHCISLALRYHRLKHLPLLGA